MGHNVMVRFLGNFATDRGWFHASLTEPGAQRVIFGNATPEDVCERGGATARCSALGESSSGRARYYGARFQ